MAKFVVQKAGPLGDETVEADTTRVTECGALVFHKNVGEYKTGAYKTELVHAFAPGRWVEVLRGED